MAVYAKLRGIINDIFAFDGGDGPIIKNNSGVIEHKNTGDSAFVVTRGADPVGDDDLVTKRYFDSNPQAGDVVCIEIPFDFNDAGSTVSSTFVPAVGGRVLNVKVDVTTAFDVDPASFTIGDGTVADRYVVDNDVKLTKVDVYEFPQYTDSIADGFDVIIGAAGGVTTGAGRVLVQYTVPIA